MNEVLQKLLLIIVIIPFFITGCAEQQLLTHDLDMSNANPGVIFGKVELIKDGKVQPWVSFSLWDGITFGTVIILPPSGNKAIVFNLDKDGFFYWPLDPGEYKILGYELKSESETTQGELGITFKVNEELQDTYIGNIRVSMTSDWYRVNIYDDFSTAVELFKNKFPNAQQPVLSLALLPEKLGDCQKIKYVCTEEWGIDCYKKEIKGIGFIRFDGVTALSPEVRGWGVSKIDTLLPTFEWSPSTKAEVSYDLVIYEAVSYYGATKYMPGRLLMYKEDIKETKYSLKDPLQPDSKYFWSIRLRLNHDVSTWSKFSFFQTILLYSEVGGSNWFTFETPSK